MPTRKLIVELVADSSSLERAFGRASRGAAQMNGSLTKAERGVLAGSGAFKSMGRSIAFASAGFLGFSAASEFLRKSVDAAQAAQVANAQLARQLSNNGRSLSEYRSQIELTTNRLSALAGFTRDDLTVGLTTILRTTPNVNKALRDLATAADLARAKHIGLQQAALIIAKTEAGNTTLLRRQGFQIAKNATAEQALAKLREVVAGQAAAGTTQAERFNAVLHNTEEIIGTALLPTLNKYLTSGAKWLTQMNESGKLQRDVKNAAHDVSATFTVLGNVIKTVDDITGSFKRTVELLIGLKVASKLGLFTGQIGRLGKAAGKDGAAGEVGLLTGNLRNLAKFGVITVEILVLEKLVPKAFKLGEDFAKSLGLKRGFLSRAVGIPTPGEGGQPLHANVPPEFSGSPAEMEAYLAGKQGQGFPFSLSDPRFTALFAAYSAGRKKGGNAIGSKADQGTTPKGSPAPAPRPGPTVQQRNTFFDNSIARILMRGGLGTLQQQLAALQQADALIRKRLAVTKDVTRRLNLEDQLLQDAAQERSIRQQMAQNAQQLRQQAFSNLIAGLGLGVARAQATATLKDDVSALEKVNAALRHEIKVSGSTVELQQQLFDNQQQIVQVRQQQQQARLFGLLGLGPTGEAKVPTVARLKRELAAITKDISGTALDTVKTHQELARIGTTLLDKMLPGQPAVRSKVQDLFNTLTQALGAGAQLPTFKHASTTALLAGLGLDSRTLRILQQRLTQVGPGGSVPGGSSAAFAAAGAGPVVVHAHTYIDGREVATTVTKAQQRDSTRRTGSRRGPYAGRH